MEGPLFYPLPVRSEILGTPMVKSNAPCAENGYMLFSLTTDMLFSRLEAAESDCIPNLLYPRTTICERKTVVETSKMSN